MILHYLKISIRILLRNKVYSGINILGLSVGIGICLLIYQYIQFESSYDQFHANTNDIYRITQSDSKTGAKSVLNGYLLGTTAKEEIPEIKEVVRIRPSSDREVMMTNSETQKSFRESELIFVDPEFLQMFDFHLLQGDSQSALTEMNNVVITQRMANKYFGEQSPIGKTLSLKGYPGGDYQITGVIENPPTNSHLQFDFIFSMQKELSSSFFTSENRGWSHKGFLTYIQLDQSTQVSVLDQKLNLLIEKHSEATPETNIGLQSLGDIHLGIAYEGDPNYAKGNAQNLKLFSIIAIFILVIAWVNYINLALAYAIARSKEIGIQKSLGAARGQIVSQFMIESFLVNLLCATLAIGIAYFTLPILINIVGVEIPFTLTGSVTFWIWFSVMVFVGTIITGIYPAIVLSSFHPIGIVKLQKSIGTNRFNPRRSLIVFQLLISLFLLSGTYLINDQINFMKTMDLGTEMEKIVVFKGPETDLNKKDKISALNVFKDELKNHSSVLSVGTSGEIPGRPIFWKKTEIKPSWKMDDTKFKADLVYIDRNFMDTYGYDFLAKSPTDPERGIFINEEALKAFELRSPEDALNKEITIFGGAKVKILGVLKNFHLQSLRQEHEPCIFWVQNHIDRFFSVKINLSNTQETLAFLESKYQEKFPGNPFDYFFLDQDFNRQYQSELQFRNLFSGFSTLAMLIGCIGLFALVSHEVTLRGKELSIRKVLGASITNLMIILSREYLVLLAIAIALLMPLIYYFGQSWLENFAFRTFVSWTHIVLPSLVLLLVAGLTIGYRTYSTATKNPVNSLRAE